MKKLSIEISKAQLTGYEVKFDDDGSPRVSANIALLTEQGRHVTDFTISTHSWMDENKFELPLNMYDPIRRIAAALEHVIVEHLREGQLALNNGQNNETAEELPDVEDTVGERDGEEGETARDAEGRGPADSPTEPEEIPF